MTAIRAPRARLVSSLRWAPEWPAAVAAIVAWVALVAGAGSSAAPAGHQGHLHVHGSIAAQLPDWTLMVVAMMLPAALPALRHVAFNSIRRRRARAMAVYVIAYVGVWAGFGLVAIGGYQAVTAMLMLDDRVLLTLAVAYAAVWQLTRAKRRAVLACKRTVPLPPTGLRADVACAHFAALQALRCVRSCWALMVVMVVAGHHALIWMIVLSALIWLEELTVDGRHRRNQIAATLAATAVLVALGA
jgi:predicted metal-binding membrane protein